jgi:hypothetical protein
MTILTLLNVKLFLRDRLVVINDFHIMCTRIRPAKADAPLIIDTDAVSTRTPTSQCFKAIAWCTLRSSSRAAISSCLILRLATLAIFTNRLTLRPSERAFVSLHLNELIIEIDSYASRE